MSKPEYADYRRITASGVIVEEPCLVYGFLIRAHAADEQITVYNGRSTSAEIAFRPKTLSAGTEKLAFNPPLLFPNGVYVAFDGKTDEVTLIYKALKPGQE